MATELRGRGQTGRGQAYADASGIIDFLKSGKRARKAQRSALADERRWLAYELHLDGHTDRQIQQRLGYKSVFGAQRARRSAEAILRAENVERIEHLREELFDKAMAQYRYMQPKARNGSERAAEVSLMALREIAELYGVKAPQRLEALIDGSGPKTEIRFVVQSLPESASRDLIDLRPAALPEASNGHAGSDTVHRNGGSDRNGQDVAGPDLGAGTDPEEGGRAEG